MAKVTSVLQLTIPERIADMNGIRPGDSISFHEAGEVIVVLPVDARLPAKLDTAKKLALFDAGTRRQRAREPRLRRSPSQTRGCKREELYHRGSAA